MPFRKKKCFLCNKKLKKDYGYIYFKAIDFEEPQKVSVCAECLDELEKNKVNKDD